MALSGKEFKQIQSALEDGYREQFDLRQMVRFGLDESLDGIAAGRTVTERIFSLIDWADRTGRTLDLIRSAYEHNQGNAALTQLHEARITPLHDTSPDQLPTAPRKVPQVMPIDFDWVTIPAGAFLMGSDRTTDFMMEDDETPQHTVCLPEYRIARVPVTNAQYECFVNSAGRQVPNHWKNGQVPWGKGEHPVVNVTWHETQAFCAWAGVRLPTEAEWEKAARGPDGRIWPWGNDPPTVEHCNFDRNKGDTTPVGSYPSGKSPYGLLDMAGNTWEWISSLCKPYPYDPDDGRENSKLPDPRSSRGGSWTDKLELVRSSYRDPHYPRYWGKNRGFRVVSLTT